MDSDGEMSNSPSNSAPKPEPSNSDLINKLVEMNVDMGKKLETYSAETNKQLKVIGKDVAAN